MAKETLEGLSEEDLVRYKEDLIKKGYELETYPIGMLPDVVQNLKLAVGEKGTVQDFVILPKCAYHGHDIYDMYDVLTRK